MKESLIAMEVFGRPASFDSQSDAIVRVEVGRLRARLQAYYASAGPAEPVLIEIPTGSYVPLFTFREEPAAVEPGTGRRWKWWLGAGAGALAALVISAVLTWTGLAALQRARQAPPVSAAGPKWLVVAVLPFADLPASEGNPLGIHLTDQIINLMPSIPHVRVVSRTSVFGLKGVSSDVRGIAHNLGAGMVLEGSVARSRDHVNVTMQLIDAESGYQIFSGAYNLDASVRELPNELARAIVTDLHLKFVGQDAVLADRYMQRRQPYALYSEGLAFQTGHDEESLRQSIARFHDVQKLDRSFAPAFAAEADSQLRLAEMHLVSPREVLDVADALAARALGLDPDLAEAHAAMGAVAAVRNWDWQAAERHLLRAIELKPSDPRPRLRYAVSVLVSNGRFEEAAEQVSHAGSFGPLSSPLLAASGTVAYFRGDFKPALRDFQRVLEVDHDNLEVYAALAQTQAELPEFESALDTLTRRGFGETARGLALRGAISARMGNHLLAARTLTQLQERSKRMYVPPFDIALVHAALGREAEALSWLEKAVEEHSPMASRLAFDPEFQRLSGNQRFHSLLRAMRLTVIR